MLKQRGLLKDRQTCNIIILPWPVSRECIPQESGRIEYSNQLSGYVVILGVCLRFKPHWMFQIYKYVIKGCEELTSCSSLIHSHMFPLLDVLYRQVGNLSFGQWRVPNFVMASGSWEHNDISLRFWAYLSIWSIIPTEISKLCSQSAVNAWSRALWLAGLATRDIQGIWLFKIVGPWKMVLMGMGEALVSAHDWIFCTIMAVSRETEAWSRDYTLLLLYDFKGSI